MDTPVKVVQDEELKSLLDALHAIIYDKTASESDKDEARRLKYRLIH